MRIQALQITRGLLGLELTLRPAEGFNFNHRKGFNIIQTPWFYLKRISGRNTATGKFTLSLVWRWKGVFSESTFIKSWRVI